MEIFAIQNISKVPSFTICFLIFLVFLTSFSLFYLSIVVKEILKNFGVLFLYGFKILSKNSTKLWFFRQKIEIFDIQNLNKIPLFTISFLFLAFLTSFIPISPIQTCQKVMEFFVVFFFGRIRDFINVFWKFLEVLWKKYWYVK